MLSKLKIFPLSSIGLEMKYEMLSVDTIGESIHLPEPALSQGRGGSLGGGKGPRSSKCHRVEQQVDSSFLLTININVLK